MCCVTGIRAVVFRGEKPWILWLLPAGEVLAVTQVTLQGCHLIQITPSVQTLGRQRPSSADLKAQPLPHHHMGEDEYQVPLPERPV